MSDIFANNLWQWAALVGFIIFALYTMFIIKNEGKSYAQDSVEFSIGIISLRIPKWWTKTQTNEHFSQFERKDTRYEWRAKLFYFSSPKKKQSIEQIFDQYLEDEKIAFDPEVQVTTESKHLFFAPQTAEQITECLRVEGTATQAGIKRIYLDTYLFRLEGQSHYYIFESWSSVLNGMLEGPFFEEAISRMIIKGEISSLSHRRVNYQKQYTQE